MDNIEIGRNLSTPYFPSVKFDADTGLCEISGESYMEEAYKFYLPLINWIKQFTEVQKGRITLEIKLIYFNTSTSKCLLDIFEILKKYKEDGGQVDITWFYDKDDPDMVEEVRDFEKEAEMEFNIQEF
jgi:hypothetical protein